MGKRACPSWVNTLNEEIESEGIKMKEEEEHEDDDDVQIYDRHYIYEGKLPANELRDYQSDISIACNNNDSRNEAESELNLVTRDNYRRDAVSIAFNNNDNRNEAENELNLVTRHNEESSIHNREAR